METKQKSLYSSCLSSFCIWDTIHKSHQKSHINNYGILTDNKTFKCLLPQELDLLGGFNPTYRKGTQIDRPQARDFSNAVATTSQVEKAIGKYIHQNQGNHQQSLSIIIIHEHSGKPKNTKKHTTKKTQLVSKVSLSESLIISFNAQQKFHRVHQTFFTLPNQSRSVRADFTSASIKFRASNLMSTKSSEGYQSRVGIEHHR